MATEIERSSGGTVSSEVLNKRIAAEWREMLKTPESTAKVAAELGCSPDELDAETPPFVAETSQSGTGVIEFLIVIGTAFAVAVAKGAGEPIGKELGARLVRLWQRMRSDINAANNNDLGPPPPAEPKK